MNENRLLQAIFRAVEFINKTELTNPSKMLIQNYYKESLQESYSQKAREAILRHTQCKTLPSLEEMRQKTADQLTPLEHLMLKIEYEAQR